MGNEVAVIGEVLSAFVRMRRVNQEAERCSDLDVKSRRAIWFRHGSTSGTK